MWDLRITNILYLMLYAFVLKQVQANTPAYFNLININPPLQNNEALGFRLDLRPHWEPTKDINVVVVDGCDTTIAVGINDKNGHTFSIRCNEKPGNLRFFSNYSMQYAKKLMYYGDAGNNVLLDLTLQAISSQQLKMNDQLGPLLLAASKEIQYRIDNGYPRLMIDKSYLGYYIFIAAMGLCIVTGLISQNSRVQDSVKRLINSIRTTKDDKQDATPLVELEEQNMTPSIAVA